MSRRPWTSFGHDVAPRKDDQHALERAPIRPFTPAMPARAVAAGVGGVAALVSLGALLRYADRLLEERAGRTESIFPSPK